MALEDAGLLHGGHLATLVALTRVPDGEASPETLAPFMPADTDHPRVVDLYGFGETAAIAEARDNGVAIAPVSEPHCIALDGSDIVAIFRNETGAFEGAAVS